eukprot:TRINITY_DN44082_c0_g1_i1.p1 TRINITY_DN44082_c0_g1~~TRINITY_DN44082_c0_g1_i1.p1  ORF type:complete len:749 (-),score=77.44 TRINITY_DN44082_c0_g1_i1:62-2308(-)
MSGDLFTAVHRNQAETIRGWIKAGQVDINQKDKQYGATPLHWAALEGKVETAKVLLRHRANPNARCNYTNATPLHWAVEGENLDVVKLLVQYTADITLRDSTNDMTATELAESRNFTDIRDHLKKVELKHKLKADKKRIAPAPLVDGVESVRSAPIGATHANSPSKYGGMSEPPSPPKMGGTAPNSHRGTSAAPSIAEYSDVQGPPTQMLLSPVPSQPSVSGTTMSVPPVDPEEVAALRRQVAHLTKESTAYRAKVEAQGSLEAKLIQLETQNKSLTTTVDQQEERIKQMQTSAPSAAPGVVEYLNEQVRNMQNSLAQARTENENLQRDVERATATAAATKKELELCVAERNELRTESEELNKKLTELMTGITTLETEKADLEIDHQVQVSELQRTLTVLETERDELSKQYGEWGELKAELAILKSEKTGLDALLRDTTKNLQTKTDELFKLKSTLTIEENCSSHHKAQLLSLQKEKRELERQIKHVGGTPGTGGLPAVVEMGIQTESFGLPEIPQTVQQQSNISSNFVATNVSTGYTTLNNVNSNLDREENARGVFPDRPSAVAPPPVQVPPPGQPMYAAPPPPQQMQYSHNPHVAAHHNQLQQPPGQQHGEYAEAPTVIAAQPLQNSYNSPLTVYGSPTHQSTTFTNVPSTTTVGTSSTTTSPSSKAMRQSKEGRPTSRGGRGMRGDDSVEDSSLSASVFDFAGNSQVVSRHEAHVQDLRHQLLQLQEAMGEMADDAICPVHYHPV